MDVLLQSVFAGSRDAGKTTLQYEEGWEWMKMSVRVGTEQCTCGLQSNVQNKNKNIIRSNCIFSARSQ